MSGDSRRFEAAKRACSMLVCAALCIAGIGDVPVFAQAQNQNTVLQRSSASDLARQNMSFVAASAGDIKPILLKNPGLMVELKRWVAKDATDHGQLIGENDLTNDAIFDRLENDVQFRAVATQILQKYGYLVPQVNPASELGKEQELLVQERIKWITQHEEQARQEQAAKADQELEKARSCAMGVQADCSQPQTSQPLNQNPLQRARQQEIVPPSQNIPNELNPPLTPASPTSPLERTQLQLNGGALGGDLSQLGSSGLASLDQSQGGVDRSSLLAQMQGGSGTDQLGSVGGFGAENNLALESELSGSALSLGGLGALSELGSNELNLGAAAGLGLNSSTSGNYYPGNSLSSFELQQMRLRNQQSAQLQPVEMIRAANPYRDIPALYDMYMQAVPRPATPKRFGIEVFQNEVQDPDLIPMDLPAGPDYVVGPGDGLAINLWGGVSRKLYLTVDREGRISLPEVGPVLVSGKSLADVQQDVQQTLRTQFRDESADVSLSRLRTVRVYEVGDVVSPGAYDISSLSTPLNALFVAGGPTPRGSMRIVKHYRGDQLVETVDMYDLLLHGVKTGMQHLENGDTVLVPPIGPQVTVEGMVHRPAVYELKDEKNLSSVLELAGGLLPTAALRHIEVQRLVAHDKQTMLSLDIPDAGDMSEVTKKLDAFQVQDGDQIRVFPIASGNEDAVYLEGHVVRPGRYSYRADMRLTDLVGSYKDILPEPATKYAEIIHLNPPDFHPSVESFSLGDALADPQRSPVLKPMDTVRIFSRFDFENPPSVAVLGDVRAPGTYQTSGDIHLADAVHLAGGLAPDAATSDAQVFRYLPDGKVKIFSVSLNQALSGDPTENIILQPRDWLLIHRSPDSVQPASVYIQGEVGTPGRYPLTTNMTVADLIRVGGGLKPSADPQTADVVHYQWQNQNNVTGEHETVAISAALTGDAKADVPLHNGDVVTIRQAPGWNDLGASILVKGEVQHPGTYGIRPGEKLSSVLERAGGLLPDAYPYGAILQRSQVRDLESQSQNAMILRVKEAQSNLELTPGATPQQQQARELTLQQYQTTLDQLTSNPPAGRVDIRISSDIRRWRNTPADVEVRAGDTLIIPKRPSYVMVTGQVFNPTAVSYRPGKSAKWYLSQSGGPTQIANKTAIFVVRADGSVVGGQKPNLLLGDPFNVVLLPGDTVVVPEKAIGGGPNWANLFTAAQVSSAVVSSLFIALHY